MRRLIILFSAAFLTLALPAAAWAQEAGPEKPSGTDHTLTTIFVVSLGIPLLLTILTLIDIAVGKHTGKGDH